MKKKYELSTLSLVPIAKTEAEIWIALPIVEEDIEKITKLGSAKYTINGISFRVNDIVQNGTIDEDYVYRIFKEHNVNCADFVVNGIYKGLEPKQLCRLSGKEVEEYVKYRLGNPYEIIIVRLGRFLFNKMIKKRYENI